MTPGIAQGITSSPSATDMLGMANGGNAPAAGPPGMGGAPGAPDQSAALESLRSAAQPLLDFFKTQPALASQQQALQNLLRETLSTLVGASGVQTPSSDAVPMAGQ